MSWISGPNPIVDSFSVVLGSANPTGPYESVVNPGNIYAIVTEQSTLGLAVVKSTTLTGTSWSVLHRKTRIPYSVSYDPTSETLLAITRQFSGAFPFFIFKYIIGTNTGSEIAAPEALSTSNSTLTAGRVFMFSDGSIGLVYGTQTALPPVKFSRYTSSWSTPIEIGASGDISRAVISSDIIHVFYADGFLNYWHQTVDSSGTSTLPNLVLSSVLVSSNIDYRGPGVVVFNGQLFLSLGANGVYKSSNLSGSTTWSLSLAAPTGSSGGTISNANNGLTLTTNGSKLWAVYDKQVVSGGVVTEDKIFVREYNSGSDTWGAAVLGVDFIANPPASPPGVGHDIESHYWSTQVLSDNTFGSHENFFQSGTSIATYTNFDIIVPFLELTVGVSDTISLNDSINVENTDAVPVFAPACVFEFYGLEKPESVEVLPVPKKFDQVAARFDKIGKVFGFRIRLIMNGTTNLVPFSVFGDLAQTNPANTNALYSNSFSVSPGRDNVYEIQFPKSVNTDIIRITFGPTVDSFHRYDVLIKVQTSGMESESKWIPMR